MQVTQKNKQHNTDEGIHQISFNSEENETNGCQIKSDSMTALNSDEDDLIKLI